MTNNPAALWWLLRAECTAGVRRNNLFWGSALNIVLVGFVLFLWVGNPHFLSWHGLFWVCHLFSILATIQANTKWNQSAFFFFLVPPATYLLSRTLYQLLISTGLATVNVICFFVFLGNPNPHTDLFLTMVALGTFSFVTLLSFTSYLTESSRYSAVSGSVIALPLLAPQMLLLSKLTKILYTPSPYGHFFIYSALLFCLATLSLGLVLFLFRYIWQQN